MIMSRMEMFWISNLLLWFIIVIHGLETKQTPFLHGFGWCYQVFEKLGPSLYDFLKRNRYHPFPVDLVREFGRQLLESVACL